MKRNLLTIATFIIIGEFFMMIFLKYPISPNSGSIMRSFPIQDGLGVLLQMIIAAACIPAMLATGLFLHSGSAEVNPTMQQQTAFIIFAQAIIYSVLAGFLLLAIKAIKTIRMKASNKTL